jgi:anti-sigma B factor antagonist
MPAHPAPVVIAPEGEIDLSNSPLLKEQFDPAIAAQCPRVIVDLSGVSYLDSSGLAVLIEAQQSVQSYGGSLALCGLRESVRHIFAIARLDQVFRIFSDQAAAQAG